MKSRIAAMLALVLLLSFSGLAADKKQLADALAQVEANLKTPAGKQYDENAGNELSQKYSASFKQCRQSLPQGSSADPFDMFLRLNAEGRVQEVLVYPETQLSNCARTALLSGQFSKPPHDAYWINIHMQPKREACG